jgi:hypothetical protein
MNQHVGIFGMTTQDSIKKGLRRFNRDYWSALSGEMKTYAAVFGAVGGGICIFFPAAVPIVAAFSAVMLPCVLGVRMFDANKAARKRSSHEITLASKYIDKEEPGKATLTGPAEDLRVFINTQQLIDRLARKDRNSMSSEKIASALAPYFNDCAEAAAHLHASCDGKQLDTIPLTRSRSEWDDYGDYIISWQEELHTLPTSTGAAKIQAAAELQARSAATTAAINAAHDGIDSAVTMKRIKLKVAA